MPFTFVSKLNSFTEIPEEFFPAALLLHLIFSSTASKASGFKRPPLP
jgi:hypothetical protein